MKLILVRHAEYEKSSETSDPLLSPQGHEQAKKLARIIAEEVRGTKVSLWTSSAKRAVGTAVHIGLRLPDGTKELQFEALSHFDVDYTWLAKQVKHEAVKTVLPSSLVVVTHLEYTDYFPGSVGLRIRGVNYADAVVLECMPYNTAHGYAFNWQLLKYLSWQS